MKITIKYMTNIGKYKEHHGNFIPDWNLNHIQSNPYHIIINDCIAPLHYGAFDQFFFTIIYFHKHANLQYFSI